MVQPIISKPNESASVSKDLCGSNRIGLFVAFHRNHHAGVALAKTDAETFAADFDLPHEWPCSYGAGAIVHEGLPEDLSFYSKRFE